MRFIVSGKHLELTEALKNKAIDKIGKVSKFFHDDTEAHITMSVQHKKHIVEVTIPFNGHVLRAEESNDDMYVAIDKVSNILERQIVKNRSKISKKVHESIFKNNVFLESENLDDKETEKEYSLVKTKKFSIKPMSIEEALLQMNLVSHKFFVFFNMDTKMVNVVYKRKDGDYGLIEPED